MKNFETASTDTKIDVVGIPKGRDGKPIIAATPLPAFTTSSDEILHGILQQFSDPLLAYRELVQNAQDAGATRVTIDHRIDPDTGYLASEFKDDGCGMNLTVIQENFLTLFSSSKENLTNKVGYWSLGRVAMFSLKPIKVEVVTRASNNDGYILTINADFSGELAKISVADAQRLIGSQTGTLVCITQQVDDAENFMAVQSVKINAVIIRSCPGVALEIKAAEFSRDNTTGTLKKEWRILNKPLGIPLPISRLSWHREIKCRENGSIWGDVYLGIDHPDNATTPSIRFTKGGITLEERSSFPWIMDGSEFSISGMKIWIESFSFKTNIGRNVVHIDSADRRRIQTIFQAVVINYVTEIANVVDEINTLDHAWPGLEQTLIRLFASMIVNATKAGYEVPQVIWNKKFIPGFYGGYYSVAELDASEVQIYYSMSLPKIEDFVLGADRSDSETITLLCLQKTPGEFDTWIKARYEGRISAFQSGDVLLEEINEDVELELPDLSIMQPSIYDYSRGYGNDRTPAITTHYAKFRSPRGTAMTNEATKVLDQHKVYLNVSNARISKLIALYRTGEYAAIASHFLIREILLEPNLNIDLAVREIMLMKDATTRFCRVNNFSQLQRQVLLRALEARVRSSQSATVTL